MQSLRSLKKPNGTCITNGVRLFRPALAMPASAACSLRAVTSSGRWCMYSNCARSVARGVHSRKIKTEKGGRKPNRAEAPRT